MRLCADRTAGHKCSQVPMGLPVADVMRTSFSSKQGARTILVVGECGDGKSTLINALRDPNAPEAKAGKAARGVTKEITMYSGKPIKGADIQIIDTPGIGDKDVTAASLLSMLEGTLASQETPIDGVIVTTPIPDGRVKLGAQVVHALVEKGFVGETKWDSIILVGTKNDRAEEEERTCFRNEVVPEFFVGNVGT
eukprot:6791939-Prymnesium_polylepis.1